MPYFNPTIDTDFNKMLDRLAHWLDHAPERILRLSVEEINLKPSPEKWSKKEICGHLIDSAINNLQRFTGAVYQGAYTLQPYPQDGLVRINQYQNQSIEDVLQLWQGLNRQIHQVACSLEAEELDIKIQIGESQVNLQWLISDYIAHLEHHLKQLFDLKEAEQGTPFWQISLLQGEQKLKEQYETAKFITLMEHGTMLVELYAPDKVDHQQPHKQDELYIVERGHGIFLRGEERVPFRSGDVLFAPAGMVHRFENFSPDFKTWVIFYGKEGGE